MAKSATQVRRNTTNRPHRGNGGPFSAASSTTSSRRSGSSSSSGAKSNPDASASRRSTSRKSSRKTSRPALQSPMSRSFEAGRERGHAAVDSIKSAGSHAIESVGASVTAHPIPVTLIGVGLAWLLLERRGIRPTESRLLARSGRAIGNAVGRAAETVGEGASYVGESVSDATSAVGDAAANGLEYSRNLWHRHPIALSAAVLSAGIAAGMLLPSTASERESGG